MQQPGRNVGLRMVVARSNCSRIVVVTSALLMTHQTHMWLGGVVSGAGLAISRSRPGSTPGVAIHESGSLRVISFVNSNTIVVSPTAVYDLSWPPPHYRVQRLGKVVHSMCICQQQSIIMRPSSLGGGRILRRTLSVRLSVCLSVRPVIVTERHVAPPSELQ